jgi:hypothetical protein
LRLSRNRTRNCSRSAKACAIVEHRRPRRQNRTLFHRTAQEPVGRRLDDLEIGDAGLAEPFDLGKPRRRRSDRFRERTEFGHQRLGERLDVAPRHHAKQQQFEKLVVGERLGAGLAGLLFQHENSNGDPIACGLAQAPRQG